MPNSASSIPDTAPGMQRQPRRGNRRRRMGAALAAGAGFGRRGLAGEFGDLWPGQFLAPLESAFGWSRTQVMAGISASAFAGFLLSGVLGRIIDGYSARIIAIAGLLLTMLSIAGFSGRRQLCCLAGALAGPAIGGTMTSPSSGSPRSTVLSTKAAALPPAWC